MDWIVGVLLLIVGAIIGFFVARYVFENRQTAPSSQTNEETVKQVLIQQASSHVAESRLVVDTLMRECEKLSEQMDAYEDLLKTQNQGNENEQLNFFGDHATVFIRNQQAQAKRGKSKADVQPRDFSMGGSGLFDGSENQQVVDKK